MLTPQDITGKEFVKAVFGGYDMTTVDDFVDTVAADYSALYKENAILKSKIKVLVEKVEEYRSTEDAMRMALLTAQKMGEDIVTEAKKKSEAMLSEAEAEINANLRVMHDAMADESARIEAAKIETGKFVMASQELIRQHSTFLSKIEEIRREPDPELPPPPAPTREEKIVSAARQIDAAVEKIVASEEPSPPPKSEPKSEPEDEGEPTKQFRTKKAGVDWSDDDEPTSPRPKFDFDNLKFGVNFKNDD